MLADEPWFPSKSGDVLLLADNSLVTVEQQSVEQVTVKTLGGSLIHYPTAQFYAQSLANLSRSGSFVVSTVFGLDYRYQNHILDDYPALIRAEIPKTWPPRGLMTRCIRMFVLNSKRPMPHPWTCKSGQPFDSQLTAASANWNVCCNKPACGSAMSTI
ncbi:MAG: hypothetical protein R3E89_15720 [Thiolinea sp.]